VLAVLCAFTGCGPSSNRVDTGGPDRVTRFFQPHPALAGSPLGVERFNAGGAEGLSLLIDQGIRGSADVSDVYLDESTRGIEVGVAKRVRPVLEAQLEGISGDGRSFWQHHQELFDAGSDAAPISEGILGEPTPSVKIPAMSGDGSGARALRSLAATMATLIEYESDVPITRVETPGSQWIQDFYVPFSGGLLGVPPHLDQESFHASLQAKHEGYQLGGWAFQLSDPVGASLWDLTEQGFRIKPLRSFLEGGNAIVAEAADGTLRVIVGRNSVRITARVYAIEEEEARALIAKDFNLRVSDVLVVPQSDFHIDLYLRAALPGRVFVASQAEGERLVEALTHPPLSPRLPASELGHLAALRDRVTRVNAGPFGRALAAQLEETRRILVEGGLEVVDYPSFYYSYFNTGEYRRTSRGLEAKPGAQSYVHINTLNNRYVTTPEGRVLSFTLSTGYPAIDESLGAFEKRHGVDEVYFLGRKVAGPRFWGSQLLRTAGGVGCLTTL